MAPGPEVLGTFLEEGLPVEKLDATAIFGHAEFRLAVCCCLGFLDTGNSNLEA